MSYFQHPTAIVDEGASIGEGTRVWHWTHISAGAVIGANCVLGQNVFVANKVVIGNGVKIQNNVSVFDCVTLEDDVFCGPGVVFTNVYNPRAFIDRKNQYKDTIVKCGATLGANATIVCGVSIGEYAFIAAGALINKNIPPFALYAGVPARQIGWVTKNAEKIPSAFVNEGKYICPDTGDHYSFKNNRVHLTKGEK